MAEPLRAAPWTLPLTLGPGSSRILPRLCAPCTPSGLASGQAMEQGKAMEQAGPRPLHLAARAPRGPPAPRLRRWLPVLAWAPHYSAQWLRMDLAAGLSVGLTVIPQALAYAEVAGLPPQVSICRCRHIPPGLPRSGLSTSRNAWCCPRRVWGGEGRRWGMGAPRVHPPGPGSLEPAPAFGRLTVPTRTRTGPRHWCS